MTETTAITTPQTFQERMYGRVKELLGELLTEEEAKQLVDKAIQDALFSSKKIYNTYGSQVREEPPQFVELVKNEVQPIVKNAVDKWIAEHQEEVNQTIEKVIQDGILSACYKSFEQHMQQPMWNLQTEVYKIISKLGGV
jgi:uncharacterized protein YcaQ